MPLAPHPDRLAQNLADRARLLEDSSARDYMVPGPGSDDARADLKLLVNATRRGLRERWTAEAEARLAGLSTPDLWAGTIQDGTARGFKVALEEALSLCSPEPAPPEPGVADPAYLDSTMDIPVTGRDLQRRREILVASGGARIRFTRKGGVLLVDRKRDIHQANCIWFEDRHDDGSLDGFVPRVGERARLFSPGFLKPQRLLQTARHDELCLEGRLGPRGRGFRCRMRFLARKDEKFLRVALQVNNEHRDHRLRIRFLGFEDRDYFGDATFPAWELVHAKGKRFLAATVVRACGRLEVADERIMVPEAQCLGWIHHTFVLGA